MSECYSSTEMAEILSEWRPDQEPFELSWTYGMADDTLKSLMRELVEDHKLPAVQAEAIIGDFASHLRRMSELALELGHLARKTGDIEQAMIGRLRKLRPDARTLEYAY